jgi:hypothetical protein
MASTAAKIGSGMRTMPAPPPNGASSTDRWGSVAQDRRSWTLMSSVPAALALPTRLWAAKWSTRPGKIVKTSMRIAAAPLQA